MDRRTLLAITLCFLIFLTWQKFVIDPRIQQSQLQSPVSTSTTGAPSQPGSPQTPPAQISKGAPSKAAERLPVQTGTGEAILGDGGHFFVGWNLKSYKLELSPAAASVNMDSVTHQAGEVTLAFDDPQLSYLNDVQGQLSRTPQGAIWKYEDANIKLTREMIASEQSPYVDVKINAEFKNQTPRYAFISLASQSGSSDPEAQDRQLVYWTQQSIERVPLKETVEQKGIGTPIKYIGATNRYFLITAVNQSPAEPNGLIQPVGNYAGRISMVYPVTGKSVTLPIRVYFGPKELDLLRKVEPTLDHTVDFGWFTVFAYPLLQLLRWLYQFVQNYGVAIILLTLLLRVVTYPLTYKSMKSMKKMSKLQPQLQKLREKYKDDREALNREMLVMMKTHGYNPMAGCLPMLIQMPIFFALYRVLYSSIELYHAPFMLWIKDLSSRDPFYVTPVLMSLAMFIQQKLTPTTTTDPAQARMMQLMPLIFGAFMVTLPSGLTVYMLVNTLAGIIQQVILNKKLDVAHGK